MASRLPAFRLISDQWRNRILRPRGGWPYANTADAPKAKAGIATFHTSAFRARRYRIGHGEYHRHSPPISYNPRPKTTGIDIARFALLSIATLPFTVWIANFTYDYFYRVDICCKALRKDDEDLTLSHNEEGKEECGGLLGRDKELAEVSNLLNQEPSKIIVIAGGNEAGKSTFVSELFRGTRSCGNRHLAADQPVTFVQIANLVDSVSTFTHILAHAFDLRWLCLRHALVDVLPFAGSEILVMKERFSNRDLASALTVITEALKKNADLNRNEPRPVIVIDGLGEGHTQWMYGSDGPVLAQRLMQWCVYVTKERRLCHVILTGNEQLVLSLTDQTRVTRGHVKVVGLGDLGLEDAAKVVQMEIPDASDDEIKRITGMFGGFIHDVKGVSRDIQGRLLQDGIESATERKDVVEDIIKARFQQQVERVVAAFAQGKGVEDSDDRGHQGESDEDDLDPYLDPLKNVYSEAQASQNESEDGFDEDSKSFAWTQLQLWKTIVRLVESPIRAVSFSELRDEVFDGDKRGLTDLMREDVLGFHIDRSSDGGWFWEVTPASPALGQAFHYLVSDGDLKERFELIEMAEERTEQKKAIELERTRLHLERKNLDMRKQSLLRTIELGKELGRTELAQEKLAQSFERIVAEDQSHDETDRLLRDKLHSFAEEEADKNSEGKASTGDIVGLQNTKLDDNLSLQHLLRDAVIDIVSSGEISESDRFAQLRKAFQVLDETNDGRILAVDLVRVIRAATGREVSVDAAKEFIAQWDTDEDKSLDYNEFTRMLLSDENNLPTDAFHYENNSESR